MSSVLRADFVHRNFGCELRRGDVEVLGERGFVHLSILSGMADGV